MNPERGGMPPMESGESRKEPRDFKVFSPEELTSASVADLKDRVQYLRELLDDARKSGLGGEFPPPRSKQKFDQDHPDFAKRLENEIDRVERELVGRPQ